MVKSKVLISEKQPCVKKEKKKFNKNNSFSGVEPKKSPKNRRKSIATVLTTPLKKKKKEKSSNEWMVSKSDSDSRDAAVKRKQVVVTDTTEDDNVEINHSIQIPKIESKKQTKPSLLVSKKKKSSNKSTKLKKQLVSYDENEQVEEHLEDKQNVSSETVESEQKFGIEASNIAKAIKAIIKLHKENPKLENQLFNDNIELKLQVTCHRVPRGPSRIIRIPLENPILTPDDEVCLIVPELKGVKNIEHEKHIEHYENLLQNKGVENIKKIMTFHEFRTEYETFEQKLRLVDLYSMFLVDGRISGKVVKKCGKIFYKKRKVPTAVKLQASKLKEHIDKALSKAFFFLHQKGDSYSVQFGHDKMDIQDLVDNVFAVIECLNKEFPGGFENIKGLHVSSTKTTSIPIYSSFKNPREVTLPKPKSKKPKGYKAVEGELTTLLNAQVVVQPTGQVLVKRTKNEEENIGKAENEEVEVKSNENGGTTKKGKKRRQNETNSEVESKENEIKKKRKNKKVKVNEASPEANAAEEVMKKNVEATKKGAKKLEEKNIKKTKDVKGKSKPFVNVNKKVKKNKKVKT